MGGSVSLKLQVVFPDSHPETPHLSGRQHSSVQHCPALSAGHQGASCPASGQPYGRSLHPITVISVASKEEHAVHKQGFTLLGTALLC